MGIGLNTHLILEIAAGVLLAQFVTSILHVGRIFHLWTRLRSEKEHPASLTRKETPSAVAVGQSRRAGLRALREEVCARRPGRFYMAASLRGECPSATARGRCRARLRQLLDHALRVRAQHFAGRRLDLHARARDELGRERFECHVTYSRRGRRAASGVERACCSALTWRP